MRSHTRACPWFLFSNTTFAVAILQFVLSSTATGACPRPRPAPNAEFFKSSSVIVGQVISEQTDVDQYDGSADGWFYRLRVERTFRGVALKIVTVYTENTNGRYPLKVGVKYLLFTHRDEGRLTIDNCGNSTPLSEAEGGIHAIEAINRSGPYGEIEGRVQQELGGDGLPGIRIVAQHGIMRFSTVSGTDGWFQMRVPPGSYELTAKSTKFIVVPDGSGLSYDDPDHFIVHKGGSAHFEYFARPK